MSSIMSYLDCPKKPNATNTTKADPKIQNGPPTG